MDKLIKAIPAKHMVAIINRAKTQNVSASFYIRGLIRKEVELMDVNIKNIPPAMSQHLKNNAAASGLSLNDYLFQVIANGGILT